MAEENNEKNIEKNSMYIEVENEEEILRLQQEVIKSNLSIEDVAKIVGKLQKLLELTKCNSNIVFTQGKDSSKIWEWEFQQPPYQPYQPIGTQNNWYSTTPKVWTSAALEAKALSPVDKVLTSNSSSDKKSTQIRKDIPF